MDERRSPVIPGPTQVLTQQRLLVLPPPTEIAKSKTGGVADVEGEASFAVFYGLILRELCSSINEAYGQRYGSERHRAEVDSVTKISRE
jgi:hypothetical protein